MTWRIEPLPLHGPIFDGAIAVYAEAFAAAPYFDTDRGDEVQRRLRDFEWSRPGYDGYVALLPNGDVEGLVYGYRGCAGQWWHDAVASKVDRSTRHEWLRDSCELVELAVRPGVQRNGLGTALVEHFVSARSESTCVLSTRTDSHAGVFYRKLGFELLAEVTFSPNGAPFLIMGKRLGQASETHRVGWQLGRRR
jgi:ribosomal protein S18 acetylase RimI-like enzyme